MVMNNSYIISSLPGLAVLIPVIGAFTIPLLKYVIGKRKAIEAYALLYAFTTLIIVSNILRIVYASNKVMVYFFGGWPPPIGIVYGVDKYAALISVVVTGIMLLIMIYSIGYFEDDDRLYLYYTLLLGNLAGMIGCLYTSDFFHLFVMLEVVSISSYILVTYYRERKLAVEAGMKYAIYGALATTVFFTSIIVAYGSFGTLNMVDLHYKLLSIEFPVTEYPLGNIMLGFVAFTLLSLYAFTFKAAIFPNHYWLPDAHSQAPSPVSALLSGLVVKIGIYCIIRFMYTVYNGVPSIQMIYNYVLLLISMIGLASALIGGFMMIVQKDAKRLIAYSTIMNMGFITMGFGLGTYLGVLAAIFHMINHSIAKSLAFLSIGLIIKSTGRRNIDDLIGIGRVNIFVGTSIGIALLSLAGIPLFNIFVSEYMLLSAFINSKAFWLVTSFILSYIVGIIAYLKILYDICIKTPKQKSTIYVNVFTGATLIILCIACIVLGIFAGYFVKTLIGPAANSLINNNEYVETIRNLSMFLLK